MGRMMSFLLGPVFVIALIFVVMAILLSFVVADMKSGQPAIVHLKSGVADGVDRDGVVTKSDKYLTVNSAAHGKEVFGWEQIQFISEKDISTSRRLDRIVDLIDLLSKFGLLATVLFFMVGLYQYGQTQKWEREKFLASAIKEFVGVKSVRNARLMLDSLALYEEGRMIDLIPQEEKAKDQTVFVNNYEIFGALTTNPHEDLDKEDLRAVAIRDCFDGFLSYLVTFDHYIEQGLITKDALSAHIGYWIDLLGPTSSLDPIFRRRVLAYAEAYEMTGVADLIRKYNKPPLWKRILG